MGLDPSANEFSNTRVIMVIKIIIFVSLAISSIIHGNSEALMDLEFMHITLLNNHPGI